MKLLYVSSERSLIRSGRAYTTKPAALFMPSVLRPGDRLIYATPAEQASEAQVEAATPLETPTARFVPLPADLDTRSLISKLPLRWLTLCWIALREVRKVDLVWLRFPGGHTFFFWLAARLLGKPIAVDFASDVSRSWRLLKGGFARRVSAFWVARLMDKLGQLLARDSLVFARGEVLLRRYGARARQGELLFIPTFGEKDLLAPEARPLHTPARLLYVGQLRREKGLPILFEALQHLLASGLDVQLALAGVGPHQEELKAEANRLGLACQVTFLGHIRHGQALWETYQSADILIMPSHTYPEGVPRVILEAWSQALPVIASRIGGVETVARAGGNALLVAPGSATALANAIQRLLESAALRQRLVAQGSEMATLLNRDTQAQKAACLLLEALYNAAPARLGKRRPRPQNPFTLVMDNGLPEYFCS